MLDTSATEKDIRKGESFTGSPFFFIWLEDST